jgi:flagellar hook-associated protein 1
MSFFGFDVAGSAVAAFQQAENVTSDNIANINTPGASRQLVNLSEGVPIPQAGFPTHFSPGTEGTGVLVASITRAHQDSLDALFRGASSSQNYYSTEQQALQATQSALGEPSAGVNTAFVAFQTAINTLIGQPGQTSAQTGVISAAQSLVAVLNQDATALQSQQAQVQTQATSVVTTINTTLDQIAALNGQIRASTAVGDNPNTYEDQRDQLIDTLSTYLPTQTSVQPDGSTLVTVNGMALVNDTIAYHLAPAVVGSNPNGTPILKVGFANDPNPSNPVAINASSGQLGGLLDLYNNKLTVYLQKLNDFTSGMAAETNRVTQGAYDSNSVAGTALFTPQIPGLSLSAGNITVGITNPNQLPISLATTAAGTLVDPLNAANNTVDTSQSMSGNTTMANSFAAPTAGPPAAQPVSGSMTVTDDGIAQTFLYNTAQQTTLTQASAAGTNTITVADPNAAADYYVGEHILVGGNGSNQEAATVAGIAGNVITLGAALTFNHTAGEAAGGNTDTIDDFITNFNAGQFGVTASFDASSQTVVFTRDPTNVGLVHRALQGANPTTPNFTISDSNVVGNGPPQPVLGTPATALLTALGANQINNINQNALNGLGTSAGSNGNALLTLFTKSFGAPSLQVQSVNPGLVAGVPATLTAPAANPTAFNNINVGDQITIFDSGPPNAVGQNQENVTVTGVNRLLNTITFTPALNHTVATSPNIDVTSAQTQTLQTYYANFIAQVGLDASTATTGTTTQTSLSTNLNTVRQSTDGINIDEETQNLIKFQNAYAAAAHTMAVLDNLLGVAVSLGSTVGAF